MKCYFIVPSCSMARGVDGNRQGSFTVAHENFTWIEEHWTRNQIVDEQQGRFAGVVRDERPWDYSKSLYMPGTIDEIQRKVQERVDVGVEYIMLHTLTPDLEQLDRIARYIVQPFSSVLPSRA